jgi:hypothetical protein
MNINVSRNDILKPETTTTTLSGLDRSTTNEPSVASDGNHSVMVTGNWYYGRSNDSGSTYRWGVASTFEPQICCDQEVIYDPHHKIFIWYWQDIADFQNENRFVVGISKDISAGGSWNFYSIRPIDLNPSWKAQWFDYPYLSLGNKDLYITTNKFGVGPGNFTGSVMIRLSLEDLEKAAPVNSSYYASGPDSSDTYTAVQGATDTMYWATHLTDSAMRIFKWPENSTDWRGITSYDRIIPKTSLPPPRGMDCTDRMFTNICEEADSRILAGWISGNITGFHWNANKGGSFPNVFVDGATFDISKNMSYVNRPALWSTVNAWLHPSVAPDAHGHLGIIAYFAGKNTSPGIGAGIVNAPDIITGGPASSWSMNAIAQGQYGALDGRWGDYSRIRLVPNTDASSLASKWEGIGYVLMGGAGNENTEVHRFVFGQFPEQMPLSSHPHALPPPNPDHPTSGEAKTLEGLGGLPNATSGVSHDTPSPSSGIIAPQASKKN